MGVGRAQVKRGQPQPALGPLTKALNIAIERDNLESQATAREWIGGVYRMLNKPEQALNELNQGLKISRQIGRKRLEAENIREIGKVQANLGQFDLALKQFQESMALFQSIKDQQGIGDTLIEVGNASRILDSSIGHSPRSPTRFAFSGISGM